ncbi:MAG: hypothetical protein ACE5HU_07120 [Acidobacteriota bacterium]
MSDPHSPDGGPIDIADTAFETILHQAVIRPAGRHFRGEPARQVEILRRLRRADRPVAFDDLHEHLRARGVLRSTRVDDAARRKAISQAVDAINIKLGTFFFQVRDLRLLEEMFRIRVHSENGSRPAYSLQDFFEVRKLSGVQFYATTNQPAGGLTREVFELVTQIRPHRLDMMAPEFESFFGNPEFRAMLIHELQSTGAASPDTPLVRVLLLDPDGPAAARLEATEQGEFPLLGALRDRIRSTLAHAVAVGAALPPEARDRFAVRLCSEAPLWRFRMIFLPASLNLRLSAPGGGEQTLIKFGVSSALYTSLHDVFDNQWHAARAPDAPGRNAPR